MSVCEIIPVHDILSASRLRLMSCNFQIALLLGNNPVLPQSLQMNVKSDNISQIAHKAPFTVQLPSLNIRLY